MEGELREKEEKVVSKEGEEEKEEKEEMVPLEEYVRRLVAKGD